MFKGGSTKNIESEKFRTRWQSLVQCCFHPSMESNLKNLIERYEGIDNTTEWRFCILTQNFDHASNMKFEPFSKQYSEALALKQNPAYKDKIYLFYGLDPRDKDSMTNLTPEWIQKMQIDGFKIYPPFGFFPRELELEADFFEMMRISRMPLTVHCSEPDSVFYNGPTPFRGYKTYRGIKSLVTRMTSPDSWEEVLNMKPGFSNLKINFGHFGALERDNNPWTDKIIALLLNADYPNLFADISFCYSGLKWVRRLVDKYPELGDKLLFGSDYFLQTIFIGERTFLRDVVSVLGDVLFDKITSINPVRFLAKPPLC